VTKDDFLKNLAIKGFDIGFGAKRNFASFDLINKLPSWAGFTSLIIAVLQLIYTNIPHNKEISVIIIFSSIAIIYLSLIHI
jgi:hypothetical protein